MLIKNNKEWNNFKNITPEKTFINRRSILKSMGFAAVSSSMIIQNAFAAEPSLIIVTEFNISSCAIESTIS